VNRFHSSLTKCAHANERITSVSTALPLLKGSVDAMQKQVVVAPLFLARLGFAAPAAENESFVAASAASSLSAKTTAVFC